MEDVVLYLRYSSDKQTEQSIEGQQRACVAYCKAHDFNIIHIYADRATSASKDIEKRLEFQQMLRDSDKKRFTNVIVYKLDRFARNRYDSANAKARLRKSGVKVISATENISSEPEGIILEAVLEGMAEFYSKELSQKVTRGMFETASKCNSTGGNIPTGYKIVNKKYVIDDFYANVIREAFEMYANGSTVKDIVEYFSKQGTKNPKGKDFSKNSFENVFKNRKYIGIYTYKDIEVPGGIPAIIDKALFERVQDRIKKNAYAPSRAKSKVNYLLTGKLFCGYCSGMMTGDSAVGSTRQVYNYYTCHTKKRFNSCTKKSLTKEALEFFIVKETIKILTPEGIDEIAEIAVAKAEKEATANTIIPILLQKEKEVNKKIKNLLRLAENNPDSPSLSDRLTELEGERKTLVQRLEDENSNIIVLDKNQLVFWLNSFCHGDINSEDYRRHIIDLLVNSVTLWDEPDGYTKITIIYNLQTTPAKTITISDLNGYAPPTKDNLNRGCLFAFIDSCSTNITIINTLLLDVYLYLCYNDKRYKLYDFLCFHFKQSLMRFFLFVKECFMSSANQFESKKTLPLFFSMVIPPMLSMFIQSFYNIVDSIFVSALGQNAIAAISIVYPLQNITLAVSVGIGVGTSSYVARSLGAKQSENASNACVISIILSIIHYLIIVVASLFVLQPFIKSFTQSPEIISYAVQYGSIVLFLCIGQQVQIIIEKIFQSYGKMMIPMYQLILGCVINIILDPILIYGLLGFPKMGVMGAAIATVVAQWSACLFGIVILLSKNSGIHLRFDRKNCHTKKIVLEIYSIAVPSIMVIALPSVLVAGLNGILSQLSELSVSVFGIYYKLQSFVFMPTSGLIQGIRPIIGYNYAAKRLDKEKEIVKVAIVTVSIIMAIGTIILWCFPQWIMTLFNAEAEMVDMGVQLFRIISIGYIPSTITFITCAEFEAIGKASISLVVTFLRQLIFLLPLAFILSRFMNLTGVWIAFPIAEIMASLICIVLLKREIKGRETALE